MATHSPSDPAINATVSASAGTGKTYLLVTRIIRLLLNGARPGGILALTFTRKAAAEMRQRLHQRLQALAACDEQALSDELESIGVSPSDEVLTRAGTLYEEILLSTQPLRIATFHAFCQELLRRFPLEAGVPPGYELLETTGIMESTAWDALFLEATKQPDSPTAKALEILFDACNSLYSTRQALMNGFLAHRSDWWAFTENRKDPVEYASGCLKKLLKPKDNPLADFFTDTRCEELSFFSELLSKHITKKNAESAAQIQLALDRQHDLPERFDACQHAFLSKEMKPLQRKLTQVLEKKLGSKDAETFVDLHQRLSEAILETHDRYLSMQAYTINQAWYRAGERLLYHYQRIKQEQSSLDFADLEWATYQLLHQPDHALWVQYKLDQKIDHLLIDEFQDTNPTQWQLILPLLEEIAAGDNARERSVFLVGDTKQSIYSFRRANPQLQHTAGEWLQQNLQAENFPLSRSWRSAPAIIQCLNFLFNETVLGSRLPQYQEHSTHRDNLWGRVEILPLIQTDNNDTEDDLSNTPLRLRNPLTEAPETGESDTHYREGLQIATRIRELIDQHYTIKRDGEDALLDYADILVLFRNRTHIAEYERAFIDTEIPFLGAEKGALLDSLEVQDIEALLNILITPFNNLALAQVLRSPVFSASDDDLIQLARCDQSNIWSEKLTYLTEQQNASPPLQRAADLLKRWRTLLGQLPIHDLLDRIYQEGNIIQRYQQAVPVTLVANVTANLNTILEMALHADSGRYPSIARFLATLKNLRASASDRPDTPPAPGQHGKIKLLTVHAAKGLEALVVFLADTATQHSRHDSYNALVDWPHSNAQPQNILLYTGKKNSPAVIEKLHDAHTDAQLTEQVNLLYVALSRAQHMLVISGAVTGKREPDPACWYRKIADAMEAHVQQLPDGEWVLSNGTPETAPKQQAETRQTVTSDQTEQEPPVQLPDTCGNIIPSSAAPEHTAQLQKTSDPEHDDSHARQRGIVIHKLLEKLAHPDPVHQIDLEPYLSYKVDRQALSGWQHEVEQLLQMKKFDFLFNPDCYEQAYKEVPITYKAAGGRQVNGIIDRLVVNDDRVWVIDYKTHPISDDSEIDALLEHYRGQLVYYVDGIRQLWPDKQVTAGLLFTSKNIFAETPTN